MMMENNFYVVARELYNNEKLTVVERASQIAAAFTTMIEAGVGTTEELEAFLKENGVNIGYNDQGHHVTTVKHPNGRKIVVTNYLDNLGSKQKLKGLLVCTENGVSVSLNLTPANMPTALEWIEGMDGLAEGEKDVVINALKQVRNR